MMAQEDMRTQPPPPGKARPPTRGRQSVCPQVLEHLTLTSADQEEGMPTPTSPELAPAFLPGSQLRHVWKCWYSKAYPFGTKVLHG